MNAVMLLIVRLHAFPNLLNYLCSISYALRFKVISFRVFLISDDDDLLIVSTSTVPRNSRNSNVPGNLSDVSC